MKKTRTVASRSFLVILTLLAAVVVLRSVSAQARQIASELGSPNVTTTIPGNQLPPPDPKFGGVIKEKASKIDALVAAAHRTAQGCAQRAAHYDGR